MEAISTPVISIVIPIYNSSKYLDECIESIVNNSFKDIEIICVNDASTDNSLDLLHSWESKDSRIHIIDLECNVKAGGARNAGIRKAKGDYVALIDSDDKISQNFLKDLIERTNDCTVDWVTYNRIAYLYDDRIEVEASFPEAILHNCDTQSMVEVRRCVLEGTPHIWASLFRRQYLLDNELFYPENVYYEDNALLTIMFLLGERMAIVDNIEPTYFYRQNPTSIVHSFSEKHIKDRLSTAILLLDNANQYGIYEQYRAKFDSAFYNIFFRNTMGMLIRMSHPMQFDRNQMMKYVYDQYMLRYGKFPPLSSNKREAFWEFWTRMVGRYPFLTPIVKLLLRLNNYRTYILRNH